MNKQDFTIEGTEGLKKAFVEESGLTNNYHDLTGQQYYLTSLASGAGFHIIPIKKPKHFILPDQWYEALEYVKEYFTEKYKVGDWVVVNSVYQGGSGNGITTPNLVTKLYALGSKVSTGRLDCYADFTAKERGDYYNIALKDIQRFATSEEIQEAQTKSFKLGEHTAVVTKDKVEIASRGSVSVSDCINWFEKELICNDTYAPLGEFTVVENTFTLDIGCVKDVPLRDIEVLYKYLKTL